MRDPKKIVSAGAICVAAALWGLDGVVLTPRLSGLPVLFVVFLIHAVPFLVMQPILFNTWNELAQMSRKSWLALMVVSATGASSARFPSSRPSSWCSSTCSVSWLSCKNCNPYSLFHWRPWYSRNA